MILFTADWHLDHENIIRYTNRPFHSVGEMNSVLLANALEVVRPGDELYVIGDFAFRPDTFDVYAALLEQVCTVVWIKGNHDPKVRHDPLALDFRWNKRHYYCCHYPWLSWRPNTVMLHGHCHGTLLPEHPDTRQRMRFDVGVDAVWGGRRYFPVSIDQVEARMLKGVSYGT